MVIVAGQSCHHIAANSTADCGHVVVLWDRFFTPRLPAINCGNNFRCRTIMWLSWWRWLAIKESIVVVGGGGKKLKVLNLTTLLVLDGLPAESSSSHFQYLSSAATYRITVNPLGPQANYLTTAYWRLAALRPQIQVPRWWSFQIGKSKSFIEDKSYKDEEGIKRKERYKSCYKMWRKFTVKCARKKSRKEGEIWEHSYLKIYSFT